MTIKNNSGYDISKTVSLLVTITCLMVFLPGVVIAQAEGKPGPNADTLTPPDSTNVEKWSPDEVFTNNETSFYQQLKAEQAKKRGETSSISKCFTDEVTTVTKNNATRKSSNGILLEGPDVSKADTPSIVSNADRGYQFKIPAYWEKKDPNQVYTSSSSPQSTVLPPGVDGDGYVLIPARLDNITRYTPIINVFVQNVSVFRSKDHFIEKAQSPEFLDHYKRGILSKFTGKSAETLRISETNLSTSTPYFSIKSQVVRQGMERALWSTVIPGKNSTAIFYLTTPVEILDCAYFNVGDDYRSLVESFEFQPEKRLPENLSWFERIRAMIGF